MGFFDSLFGRKASVTKNVGRTTSGPDVLCSACYSIAPSATAHVIPWWNAGAEDFFTTFRCENCWLSSLDETVEKVSTLDDDARKKFVEFLRRHKVDGLADSAASGSLQTASGLFRVFLDDVRSRKVVLSA